jgi:CubicO group peptidase (beta-lactamase class C family)
MSLSRDFKKPVLFAIRQLRIASLLIALFLAAAANLAAAQESKLSPAKRTQIEMAVSKFMATTHVPGLSVAVVENGEYEWGGGFGLADVENNSPANTRSSG